MHKCNPLTDANPEILTVDLFAYADELDSKGILDIELRSLFASIAKDANDVKNAHLADCCEIKDCFYYPIVLIREDGFTEHIKKLITESSFAIQRMGAFLVINWEKTAEILKGDYKRVLAYCKYYFYKHYTKE